MIFLYLSRAIPDYYLLWEIQSTENTKNEYYFTHRTKAAKKTEYSKSLFVPFVTCPVVPFCHVPQGILGVFNIICRK